MSYNTQGQGAATAAKQVGFRVLFRQNLGVFAFGSHGQALYPHFDLTAGDGMNGAILGSPLTWCHAAREMKVERFVTWFVERDGARAAILARRPELAELPCEVVNADHRDFIYRIPALLHEVGLNPAQAFGSVVVDPNGHKDMPLLELAWLSRECPHLDLILNWSAASEKRWRVYLKNRNAAEAELNVPLDEAISRLGKRHWLIRSPLAFWQWSIVFGTNYEQLRPYRRLGFYDLRSQAGGSILDRLSHTEKERNGKVQGSLF